MLSTRRLSIVALFAAVLGVVPLCGFVGLRFGAAEVTHNDSATGAAGFFIALVLCVATVIPLSVLAGSKAAKDAEWTEIGVHVFAFVTIVAATTTGTVGALMGARGAALDRLVRDAPVADCNDAVANSSAAPVDAMPVFFAPRSYLPVVGPAVTPRVHQLDLGAASAGTSAEYAAWGFNVLLFEIGVNGTTATPLNASTAVNNNCAARQTLRVAFLVPSSCASPQNAARLSAQLSALVRSASTNAPAARNVLRTCRDLPQLRYFRAGHLPNANAQHDDIERACSHFVEQRQSQKQSPAALPLVFLSEAQIVAPPSAGEGILSDAPVVDLAFHRRDEWLLLAVSAASTLLVAALVTIAFRVPFGRFGGERWGLGIAIALCVYPAMLVGTLVIGAAVTTVCAAEIDSAAWCLFDNRVAAVVLSAVLWFFAIPGAVAAVYAVMPHSVRTCLWRRGDPADGMDLPPTPPQQQHRHPQPHYSPAFDPAFEEMFEAPSTYASAYFPGTTAAHRRRNAAHRGWTPQQPQPHRQQWMHREYYDDDDVGRRSFYGPDAVRTRFVFEGADAERVHSAPAPAAAFTPAAAEAAPPRGYAFFYAASAASPREHVNEAASTSTHSGRSSDGVVEVPTPSAAGGRGALPLSVEAIDHDDDFPSSRSSSVATGYGYGAAVVVPDAAVAVGQLIL